jgi:triphosphoribosyl-dephospho-CoA synthase
MAGNVGQAFQPDSKRLEHQIRSACILEAAARKPGNVHPHASFPDLNYQDFVDSAEAVSPILARTVETGVGQAVLDAVRDTQDRLQRNTNLGIVLLLAPLAAVPSGVKLVDGIEAVLTGLSLHDAELVYEAIRLAHPGGMGQVPEQDISASPTQPLVDVMRLAADYDLIARQYTDNFSIVLGIGMPYLARAGDFVQHWETAIIGLQLKLLSQYPDSLIQRKCGREIASEASQRARGLLHSSGPGNQMTQDKLDEFDRWLRADGHRRNPGTIADLIAASLFAAFRDGGLPIVPSP